MSLRMNAQPVLNQPHSQLGVTLYPDASSEKVYYYAPGTLSLATRQDGRPDFRLTMTRYTSTALTNHPGKTRFNSIMQFKILMKPFDDAILQKIKQQLPSDIRLSPLPIQNIRSTVVHIDINPEGIQGAKKVLENGHFESTDQKLPIQTYWTERNYTLRLSSESAQLLQSAFEKGQTLLGFSYSFEAAGVSKQVIETSVKENLSILKNIPPSDTTVQPLNHYTIYSNAFEILLDTRKYPELIQKIDLNAERLPADYAALEVRCYDFNNELRHDLDAKKIEIEAQGITQKTRVTQQFTFLERQPDVFVKTIQFPYAVRTDKPFRYRILEITKEGRPQVSAWREQKNWVELLDITGQ